LAFVHLLTASPQVVFTLTPQHAFDSLQQAEPLVQHFCTAAQQPLLSAQHFMPCSQQPSFVSARQQAPFDAQQASFRAQQSFVASTLALRLVNDSPSAKSDPANSFMYMEVSPVNGSENNTARTESAVVGPQAKRTFRSRASCSA
jgi:hypothetical protein